MIKLVEKLQNQEDISNPLNEEMYLDKDFTTLVASLLEIQTHIQLFPSLKQNPKHNLNQTKGLLGEAVCSVLFEKIVPNFYFLDGQKGEDLNTSSEKITYKAAQDFFAQYQEYEYVVASRAFGGGQRCALDVVEMLISRKDVENWNKEKLSTAIYFVFEAKTDTSKLSKAQGQFSYVTKQASHMSRNTKKIEDRSQLGKDLIKAVANNRVIYIAYHLDTKSGKITARQIQ